MLLTSETVSREREPKKNKRFGYESPAAAHTRNSSRALFIRFSAPSRFSVLSRVFEPFAGGFWRKRSRRRKRTSHNMFPTPILFSQDFCFGEQVRSNDNSNFLECFLEVYHHNNFHKKRVVSTKKDAFPTQTFINFSFFIRVPREFQPGF